MAARRGSRKLDSQALWDFALGALAGRAHSAAELKRKLMRRAELPSDVIATLSRLREYGLLDDQKFSDSYAAARLANQGFGKFRVLRDLRARQVAANIADKAVKAAFASTDERELAANFLLRKYRGKDLSEVLQDDKNFAAAYRRLRVAGFSSGAALDVLRRYNRRANEWEPGEEETSE
ncbi:MAG TPA: regulatory protein RecX [Bryobacteraceae bacterium]|jgi:regulatory protein